MRRTDDNGSSWHQLEDYQLRVTLQPRQRITHSSLNTVLSFYSTYSNPGYIWTST